MCKLIGETDTIKSLANSAKLRMKVFKTCGEKKDPSMVHFLTPLTFFYSFFFLFIYHNRVELRRSHTRQSFGGNI